MARHVFSFAEYAALGALPAEDRLKAFFRCWTRQESFIKARGEGLSFPLTGFDVSFADTPPLLLGCRAAPGELARWTMISVEVEEGYAAALTGEGTGWRVIPWTAPEPN